MKTKTSLLILYLASSGLVSSHADTDSDDSLPQISEPVYSDIELGIGQVTNDAYYFGRYNGLQTRGPFVVGDIDTERINEDGRFWRVRGTNLGLESRYLRLETGRQGSHKFFLEWDELPNYRNNTVKTPFDGVGSGKLTLPSGFDINTNLDANLKLFELQTKRERIKAGANFIPTQRWLFDIDFSHENKQGVDAIGAPLVTGATPVFNNVTTSLLPEPIDYNTDQVNAKLTYAGDNGQLDLTYHASFFDNTYDSLSWQDPFNPTTGVGNMSLAPDNEFHQLSLTGTYSLPHRNRLTGLVSMGRMTQNQQFQPYTINPGVSTSPLPRDSLDGEVWLANAQLKLSSQPLSKLRLNAELRYNERANQTPVETYNYVVLDTGLGTATQNNPYSYENSRASLDASYRFNAIASLRGGYKYNGMKRSNFDAGREDTDENTLFAKLKVRPHSTVDLELHGETSSRDGSDFTFDTDTYQNQLMRKYNLADRDRNKLGALIDYMATEKLYLSARADYSEDDYQNTQIGLTDASQPTVTIDFSYQPLSNLTTYGYYTWENIQSSQNGFEVSGGGATTGTGWQADFDDTFDTVGIGAKWTDLGKWDLGADLVYSKAIGHIEMKDLANPGTETQFPDNRTEMASIKLWTDYNHSEQLVYKLGYWYEDYTADNWAVDGLPAFSPTSGILLLGNQTMDYEVRVITASASYRFQ